MAKKKVVSKKVTRKKRPRPKAAREPIKDAEIVVDVETEGKIETLRIDALLLKVFVEGLERKHKLTVHNGTYVATVPFLRDMADKMPEQLGVRASPTVAMALWKAVNSYFIGLQKKTS